jgi:hypothetical protein
MTTWRFLVPNISWILGAAVILSVWTFVSYRAACYGATGGLRHSWANLAFRRALCFGALLISLSQIVISQVVWQQLVWILFSVVSGVGMIEHLPWLQGGLNDSVGKSD